MARWLVCLFLSGGRRRVRCCGFVDVMEDVVLRGGMVGLVFFITLQHYT